MAGKHSAGGRVPDHVVSMDSVEPQILEREAQDRADRLAHVSEAPGIHGQPKAQLRQCVLVVDGAQLHEAAEGPLAARPNAERHPSPSPHLSEPGSHVALRIPCRERVGMEIIVSATSVGAPQPGSVRSPGD